MDLVEFTRRRERLLLVMHSFDPLARVPLRTVEIVAAGTAGQAGITISPAADGAWLATIWGSERGGVQSMGSVTAASVEHAIDWAWMICVRDYREKFVAPASLQYDCRVRRIQLDSLQFMTRPARARQRRRQEHDARLLWSDVSTNSLLLGLVARFVAGRDSDAAMRLARNPSTPPAALAALAEHGGIAARWQVAGNPAASAQTIARLRAWPDFGVRWYLAARNETPTADIVEWAREDSALWSTALDRTDITSGQVDELDRASSGSLRSRMVEHPATSPELLSRIVRASDEQLSLAALESGRLPEDDIDAVLEQAAGWLEWGSLRHHLMTNRLPIGPARVQMLVGSDVVQWRMLAAAASSIPDTAAERLAVDPAVSVRMVLAASDGTPSSIMQKLAIDSDWSVREAVAGNPAVSAQLLVTLSTDEKGSVRRTAVLNPALPRAAVEALLTDPDTEIARAAVRALSTRP